MKQFTSRSIKRHALIATVIVSILAVVLGSVFYLNPQLGYNGKTEPITFGDLFVESSSLVYIAQNQHFFDQNGINLTIKPYQTALDVTNAVLNNEIDFGGCGEFPFVNEAIKENSISIIGTMNKYESNYLIGRVDSGIHNISDLKGKRIGVTLGGGPEFYLGRFLEINNIPLQEVTVVNLVSSQYVNAIVNGTVDAIVTRSPFINQIEEQLADNTVIWPAQNNQLGYALIFCKNNLIAQHPELIVRFLKSLSLAENYLIDNPDSAKAIVQKQLNKTDTYMLEVWPQQRISLSIDQSLILAMNDETRWLISNNRTNATSVPNFIDYIYFDGLETVQPNSINIVR